MVGVLGTQLAGVGRRVDKADGGGACGRSWGVGVGHRNRRDRMEKEIRELVE